MIHRYRVEIEQEEDGRFLADVIDLPGALAYGASAELALAHVQARALRVLADRLEHGEWPRGPVSVTFETASAAASAAGPPPRPAASTRRCSASAGRRSATPAGPTSCSPREGFPDFAWAFHERDEIGPRMLARIARRTGLTAEDL